MKILTKLLVIILIAAAHAAYGQRAESAYKGLPIPEDQHQPSLSETNFFYSNEPIWKKLYGVNNSFRKLQDQVTEYQSTEAVNAPDKKEVYTISVSIESKKIIEISDKHKPDYRIRSVYTYGNDHKIKSKEIYDDNLDGKGWQFNEKFLYSYDVDKKGNYYNEVIASTDPRLGADPAAPRKVKAFYNSKRQLVKYTEVGYTYEFSYNDKGDLIQEVDYSDAKSTRGETVYKYVYDAKGNWMQRETYRTNSYKDNVLEEVVNRKIDY